MKSLKLTASALSTLSETVRTQDIYDEFVAHTTTHNEINLRCFMYVSRLLSSLLICNRCKLGFMVTTLGKHTVDCSDALVRTAAQRIIRGGFIRFWESRMEAWTPSVFLAYIEMMNKK